VKDTDNSMSVRPPRADVGQSPLTTNKTTGAAGEVAAPKETGKAGGGSDTLTLTSSASEMRKLEESLARIPDVDNARVAEIKASIADGSYQLNPEKIVDGLLKIEKDLS